MLVSQFRAMKLGLTSALWNITGSKGSVLFGRWQQRHTRRVGVYGKFTWATHHIPSTENDDKEVRGHLVSVVQLSLRVLGAEW